MAPLFYEDTSIEPPEGQPAVRDRFVEQGVKAAAHVPLITKGQVIGVLYLDLLIPHRFSDEEKSVLEVFATQAAIAIENARLYKHISQNLERRIEELEVLTEIGRTVSSLGIDEILYQIWIQADKIMDARNIQIAFYDEDTDTVEFRFAPQRWQMMLK